MFMCYSRNVPYVDDDNHDNGDDDVDDDDDDDKCLDNVFMLT